jgi:hypothetical protein
MSTSVGPNIVEDGLVLSLDPANQKSYSPNMFPFPTDFFSFATTGGRVSVSRDIISSPVGNTPIKLTQTSTGGRGYTTSHNNAMFNVVSASVGETWTFSYWAKASVVRAGSGASYIFGANSSGVAFVAGAWLNLSGVGGRQYTQQWQRFTHTFTFTNPDVAFIHIRVDTDNDAEIGDEYWFDGFQVERSSSATPFNPNYYGNIINDMSNNGNDGILTGNILFDDANQGSTVFDGSSSYINIGDVQQYMYSVSLWAYFSSEINMSSESKGLFYFGNNDAGQAGVVTGPYTGFIPGETLTIANVDGTYQRTSIQDNISSGWHNIVINWNGTKYDIYIDLDKKETTYGTSPAGDSSLVRVSNLQIGQGAGFSAGISSGLFNGNISVFSIFNRSLSEDEIKQNFNALRSRYGI